MLDELEQELAALIIAACRVTGPLPADLSPDAPLFGPASPFGLDSLDAVEVVVMLQRQYRVRIDGQEMARRVLRSLRSLAGFIRAATGR